MINDYLSLKFHELYKSNSNDRLAVASSTPVQKVLSHGRAFPRNRVGV